MRMFKILKTAFLLFCVAVGLISFPPANAQSDEVTVPDVTGLSVPAAAAVLNRNGIALGLQYEEQWTESLGQPANTIIAQSLAPNSITTRGTTLDITVLRSPNMLLIYRPRHITLINQADAPADLTGLVFNALDGNTPASFPASNWLSTLDGDGHCAQLWAEARTGPERPEECTGVQRWLSTINTSVHFWTDLNGVTRFNVVYNGVELTVCEAAVQGAGQKECAFFLPIGTAGGEATGHVFLAYTTDRLIVLNQSDDKWMPVDQTTIRNFNPNVLVRGAALTIGDATLFNNANPVADVTRLAPGQCLMFTNSSPNVESPPQPCDVIARLDVNPSLIFWAADFEVDSATDDQRHTCPAATANKLTICVMPR